jgi:hypothetical protein
MKSVITFAIAVTALIATASPARAQSCIDEGVQLCGFVWDDANKDGIQNDDTDMDASNGDQSGIDGVKVTLFVRDTMTNTWSHVSEDITENGGFYKFPGVPEGEYKVVVSIPAVGEVPSPTHAGGDLYVDSDGTNDAGGAAAQVCIGNSGSCVTSQQFDFGFHTATKVSPGTGTPGYWKNHTEVWTGVTIGGVYYTSQAASDLMGKVSKDKTISLFAQLVAAKLNVTIGNESGCIDARISEADTWMASHPVGSGVTASSTAWQQVAAAHRDLDDYNNGRLCAPHRN